MAVHVEPRLERLAFGLDEHGRIFDERDADFVRAGFDGDAELQVRVDTLGVFIGPGGLHGGEGDAFAVEEDFDLVRFLEALDLLVAVAGEADLNLVVAVLRKRVGDERAAARAEREALDVFLLGDVGFDAEGIATGDFARGADGETGDFLRGGGGG